MSSTRFESLADILRRRASGALAEANTITYLRGDSIQDQVDAVELLQRAQRAAYALRMNGVAPGDRVLLMLTSQCDFVDTFLGAVWADAIPVPLFPPMFSIRPEDFIANFGAITTASGAQILVAADEIMPMMQGFAERMGSGFRIVPRSAWDDSCERLEIEPRRHCDDLALIQFTSGSTGTPKGVALSHANVLANAHAIGYAVSLDETDVGVSWLPLYHDMGLIGVLATLYWGGRAVLLAPQEFARDPGSWLRAISAHGGTLSPAPNFAYRRCLRLSDERLGDLDLATWRVAFNGSEPVDAETVRDFTDRFAPSGFRAAAFYPVYGLAEHTLAVSFPVPGQGVHIDIVDRVRLAESQYAASVPDDHPDAMSFVSVGKPLSGVSVEIRDEDGVALQEGFIGEVCVSSASVMRGYFGNAAATAEVLVDGWLRTGDLGYFKNGLLYITGRKKDLIIRAGRNYYPEDVESAAATVGGIRAGRAAAFSIPVDPGEEHLVLIAECLVSGSTRRAGLARDIARAVAARIGFRPERIELCKRGTLPVTSSGKVRRQVVRARYLNGGLGDR